MTARPVLAPDGTRYASAAEAADATGMCRKLVAKKAGQGRDGWRYADVEPSLVARVLEILATVGSRGATVGEAVKVMYGGCPSQHQRSRISATLIELSQSGRAVKTAEQRAVTASVRPGAVYVIAGEAVEQPARIVTETGAGNIRRRERTRPVVPVERDVAVLPEGETPAELLRYAHRLRRDWPVVPLKCGKWLVDDVEVSAADLVALATGEIRLRELRGQP